MIRRTSMREAVALGIEELSRTLELLRSLEDGDWARPTDCAGWDVHDVVAHLVGQFEGAARPDRLLRRVRAARRMPGFGVLDGHNELQVRERKDVPPSELVELLEGWGGRGIRSFGRIPAPIRRMRLSRLFPEAAEMPEDSLDFLIRVIGPRDPWMHRIDITAATGRPFQPDGHDAKIVEQVVGDLNQHWRLNNEGDLHDRPSHARPPATQHAEEQPREARLNNEGDLHDRPSHARPPATQHAGTGQAVRLVLEGPAGGEWVVGQGVPVAEVRCDATEYCRHASGRPASPASVTGECEVGEALLAVKISF